MSWAVFQIGAREHYAVARAMQRAKQSVTLYSDVLIKPAFRRFVPNRWKTRWHAELNSMNTVGNNFSAGVFEATELIRRSSSWDCIIKRNEWFGARASSAFQKQISRGEKPVVFSYSYAARQIFEVAKSAGCKCILGQIDPGPGEMQLVQRLATTWGDDTFTKPPESYWDNWRIECELADKIVVNSEWSRELLIQELGCIEKIEVVPLAYKRQSAKHDSQPTIPTVFTDSRPLRVLFLGQVVIRKGVKELAEAIRKMGNLPIEWTIIGNGPQHLLDELSACPKTTVVGGVSRDQASQWYKKSDLFILPTHSDGYAITQLEAASFGLPIIASRFCGDVVQDGKNGLILTGVTASAIVDAIRFCLANPIKLMEMKNHQLNWNLPTLEDLSQRLLGIELGLQGVSG